MLVYPTMAPLGLCPIMPHSWPGSIMHLKFRRKYGSDRRPAHTLAFVSSKSEREAAWDTVARYHEEQLSVLVQHVAEAVDQFRSGTIDVFEADQVMFQYSRAAKELWKFCNGSDIYVTAGLIRDYGAVDWWDQGAPRRR